MSSHFLRLLAKKGAGGIPTGHLAVNGVPADIAECVADIGYIPAVPELHPELTVRETLKFYARLRLPGSTPERAKASMVHDVLEMLGLLHLQDTRVGTAVQAHGATQSSRGWDGEDAEAGTGTQEGLAAGTDDEGLEYIPWEARRLLSAGVEMVADPALLCAESPVADLSPIAAARVLGGLRAIARIGGNVIVSLTSTRTEVFATFDRVLLLDADGRTAFLGPPSAVGPYFALLGYAAPAGSAIVHHVTDILSGFAQPAQHPLKALGQASKLPVQPSDLGTIWRIRLEREALPTACLRALRPAGGGHTPPGKSPGRDRASSALMDAGPQIALKRSSSAPAKNADSVEVEPANALAALRAAAVPTGSHGTGRLRIPLAAAAAGTTMGAQGYTRRAPLGAIRELYAFLVRSAQQLLRHPVTLMVDVLVVMVPGLVLGLLYRDFQLQDIPRVAQLVVLTVGMASATTSTRLFGLERSVWVREAGMGMNTLWYFCGKVTAHLPEEFITPMAFLLWFYTFSSPRIGLGVLYLCLLSVVYCTSGVGIFLSTVLPLRAATMATVLFVVVFSMLAGTDPPLPRLRASGDVFTEALVGISFSRYAVEALTVYETQQWLPVWDRDIIELVQVTYGFNPSSGPLNICVLWAMGFILRLGALAALSHTAAAARSGKIKSQGIE
jgi:ABC-type branched-subunit amino acid transport system ATPase component